MTEPTNATTAQRAIFRPEALQRYLQGREKVVLPRYARAMSPLWAAIGRLLGVVRRVPEVLQFEATECGVACLAMILRYYGCDVTVSELRERTVRR